MADNVFVKPKRNEDFSKMMKRFSRKVTKSGLIDDYKASLVFEKPSVRKRMARKRAAFIQANL